MKLDDKTLLLGGAAVFGYIWLASRKAAAVGELVTELAGKLVPPFAERTAVLDPAILLATAQWVWPVEVLDARTHSSFATGQRLAAISDGWRSRSGGKWHLGADIMFKRAQPRAQRLPQRSKWHDMPTGMRALAAGPGKVSASKDIGTGGYVRIHHASSKLVTQYMHLARRDVKTGDTVHAGQPIGIVGHDPIGYRLNHMHFEFLSAPREMHLDPEPYLKRWHHVWIDPANPRLSERFPNP